MNNTLESGRGRSDPSIIAVRASIALLLSMSLWMNYRQHKTATHLNTSLDRVSNASRHNYRAAENFREQNRRLRQEVRFHNMVGCWSIAQAHIAEATGQHIPDIQRDNVGLPIFSSPIQSTELSGVITVPQDFQEALKQINYLYAAWHNIGEVETIARLLLTEQRNDLDSAKIAYLEGIQLIAARYHQQLREIILMYRRDVLRNTMIVRQSITIPNSTMASTAAVQESTVPTPEPEMHHPPHAQRVRRPSPSEPSSPGIFGTVSPN